MDTVVAALVVAQESTAEEGLHIIISMLVVGLIFLGVIALGQTFRYFGHRRAAKKRTRRVY
jgi:heme/copper-type cytochrome/quinol oxidase subunit 2